MLLEEKLSRVDPYFFRLLYRYRGHSVILYFDVPLSTQATSFYGGGALWNSLRTEAWSHENSIPIDALIVCPLSALLPS